MKNHIIEVDNRFAATVILACLAAVTAATLFVYHTGQQFWF